MALHARIFLRHARVPARKVVRWLSISRPLVAISVSEEPSRGGLLWTTEVVKVDDAQFMPDEPLTGPVAMIALAEQPREVTAPAATELLGYWPPDLALHGVDFIRSQCGLEWWEAIACGTLLVRILLLPLALYNNKVQARVQAMRSHIAPLQMRIQQSGGRDESAASELQELYAQHGVSPLRLVALPLAQVPVFLSCFVGLRRLCDSFPSAHTGGIQWFVDLGATDATYAMPIVSALSAFVLVRVSMPRPATQMNAAEAGTVELMRTLMSAVALISLPVACSMPASVLVFWIANNTFSLCYASCMQLDAVRDAVGLPPRDAAGAPSAQQPADRAGPRYVPSGGASVNKDQVRQSEARASDSLLAAAASLRAAGKLKEAAVMERRALALHDALCMRPSSRDPVSSCR